MGEPVASGAKRWQVAFLAAVVLGFAAWGVSAALDARHEAWADRLDAHLRALESSRPDLYQPEVFHGVLSDWHSEHPEPWAPPSWSVPVAWLLVAAPTVLLLLKKR